MQVAPLERSAALFRVQLCSHYFLVSDYDNNFLRVIRSFIYSKLAEFEVVYNPRTKQSHRVVKRKFVGSAADESWHHFHINIWNEFKNHIFDNGYDLSVGEVTRLEMYAPERVSFDLQDSRQMFDYQRAYLDYLLDKTNQYVVYDDVARSKLVSLQPGQGKTFIACILMYLLQVPVLVVIKSMYISKWISDVSKAFRLQPGDLTVIESTADMVALSKGMYRSKIYIISNTTYANYIKSYEQTYELWDGLWGAKPHELCRLLGVGLKLVDEGHQDILFNFKADCYTHVPLSTLLSGTFLHDSPLLTRIYQYMYPDVTRCKVNPVSVHADMEAIQYRLSNPKKIKCINYARNSYNHVAFEQSLMRDKQMLTAYLSMIADLTQKTFLSVAKPGQKFLVFAATIDMCRLISKHLSNRFPNEQHIVYVGTTNKKEKALYYERMLDSNIIVSTLKSLGTAIDIPDLFKVLMTNATNGEQLNRQAFGRLRKLLHRPDCTPVFMYLVCKDIRKHVEYHRKKMVDFKNDVKAYRVYNTDYCI